MSAKETSSRDLRRSVLNGLMELVCKGTIAMSDIAPMLRAFSRLPREQQTAVAFLKLINAAEARHQREAHWRR